MSYYISNYQRIDNDIYIRIKYSIFSGIVMSLSVYLFQLICGPKRGIIPGTIFGFILCLIIMLQLNFN